MNFIIYFCTIVIILTALTVCACARIASNCSRRDERYYEQFNNII